VDNFTGLLTAEETIASMFACFLVVLSALGMHPTCITVSHTSLHLAELSCPLSRGLDGVHDDAANSCALQNLDPADRRAPGRGYVVLELAGVLA
jgi:hypothetical protein